MVRVPQPVLERLRCPRCDAAFAAAGDGVECANGHRFDGSAGYIDFSTKPTDEDTARTLDSFGYEWTTFDAVQDEDEAFWRGYTADVPLDRLAGGVGIDLGCGKGRFTKFTARHLAATVALDGSLAVEAAARNLQAEQNVVVVRADLRAAPFAVGSFDFVSCLGVLHHLPDPEAGFRVAARLLAPGGLMLIYVYSRPSERGVRSAALAAATAMRRRTVHMPHQRLRTLSAPLAALLYAGIVLPGQAGERLGIPALAGLPLHTYRRRPLRSLWLDTFDRLSAPLEARYLPEDVLPWFARAGLIVRAVRESAGLFIVAERP